MAYNILTQPEPYMAAYSAVPIKVLSDDWNTSDNFEYLFNILWDPTTITNSTQFYIGSNFCTKLNVASSTNYTVGDLVYISDTGTTLSGYYNVLQITNSTSIVINLVPTLLDDFASGTGILYKVIKYKVQPDLNGYGKLDLSPVLKDFVSQNLTGETLSYGLTYNGPDTEFSFKIDGGYSSRYRLEFYDNFADGDYVGFYNPTITSLTGIPFQIGDQINIEQDLAFWNYDDNYADGDYVGLTGSTLHNFRVNQPVTVTGQITNPSYNGSAGIVSVLPNSMVINKLFGISSPVEPGIVWGVPRPEYNGVATITDVYIDGVLGLCIVIDKLFTDASQVIGGFMSYADGRITEITDLIGGIDVKVYNARLNNEEYSINGFDKYVIQNRDKTLNNISTILKPNSHYYRVEKNTIGFLLSHKYSTTTVGMGYFFYDSTNTLIGRLRIPTPTNNNNYYMPIGMEQISLESTKIESIGTFSAYSGSVSTYVIVGVDSANRAQTNGINFELNNDCSKYEIYHLIWKDKNGSFISYPFNYVSRDKIEVDRKSFYKKESNWDNNSFGYDQYSRGDTDFYVKSRKSLVINSGWLYEFERDLIEDLMQSPSVYLQTPDNKLYGCKLAETSLEIYKEINEDLFQYSFNVILSNNNYRY